MKGKRQWTWLFFSGCVCVYVRPLPLRKSTSAHTHSLSTFTLSAHPHTHCSRSHFHFLSTDQESLLPAAISLRDVSWLPLARYSKSCSWTCLFPRLCLTARSVLICFHYWMLTLGLWLDLLVSGGLVEDNHHARSLEDSVFCHLVTVSVHVTFVYQCHHTFYLCAPLHICHVCQSAWLTGPNPARVASLRCWRLNATGDRCMLGIQWKNLSWLPLWVRLLISLFLTGCPPASNILPRARTYWVSLNWHSICSYI